MSTQLVVLAGLFLGASVFLQWLRPGDQLATMFGMAALTIGGVGYAKKHREASKARKDAVDLEKTATSLRRELFEKTGSWQ